MGLDASGPRAWGSFELGSIPKQGNAAGIVESVF